MHTVTIVRDRVSYGPYNEEQAVAYYAAGQILRNDLARIDTSTTEMTFKKAVSKCGWRLPCPFAPWKVFWRMGVWSIFPLGKTCLKDLVKSHKVQLIVLAGILPLVALVLSASPEVQEAAKEIPKVTALLKTQYTIIALQASILWGMVFWAMFKTESSSGKIGICCFCVTALFSVLIILQLVLHGALCSVGLFETSEAWRKSGSLGVRFVGNFFRAGLPEEICKAFVIFLIVRRPGAVLKPQDVVLYGLLSGFGFGINEGLDYQMTSNRASGNVDAIYVLNFIRLTSCPFLHACWCGISSYFIAYAAIAPMYRYGLWILAILIPATLHSAYNAFPGVFMVIPAAFGIVLMFAYLHEAKNLRRKLL